MNPFSIWQVVQPVNPQHPRAGQAGTVQGLNPEKPDEVAVRWDLGGVEEVVKVSELRALN